MLPTTIQVTCELVPRDYWWVWFGVACIISFLLGFFICIGLMSFGDHK